MQYADESVAEGALGMMAGVDVPAVLVVEGAGTLGFGQRAERPLIERVIEPSIANVAGQHGTLSTSGFSRFGRA